MRDTYKPETIAELLNKAEKVLVNAHNSGYILGVEQGVQVERERIIKLLETDCKPNDHDYINGCNCDITAAIKGENK